MPRASDWPVPFFSWMLTLRGYLSAQWRCRLCPMLGADDCQESVHSQHQPIRNTYEKVDPTMKLRRTRALTGVAIGAALVLAMTGCSTAGAGGGSATTTTSSYMVAKKTGPLLIGFSNSFAGNSWRTQMIAELKYAVDTKLKGDVSKLTITDANNSVSSQLSQINDLVTSGIDILMIDAASATALNGAIERAQKQGVLVVSFDNAATSKAGIVVNPSQEEFGRVGGQFLAKQLKKGD